MSEAIQVEHTDPDPKAPLFTIKDPQVKYDVYRLQIAEGFFWEFWGPEMGFPNWWYRFWSRFLLGFKWTKTGEQRGRFGEPV